MSDPGTPSLDQLRVFLAVVETGSFAAAGRRLNRAVSVISYGVANLEAQLGLTLFDRKGTRKPILTQAGVAVLAEARGISRSIETLRAKVKGLTQGLEAEVNLAVDVMMPAESLARVLRTFAVEYPTVTLRLHVEALGAVNALVIDRRAEIGVSGPIASEAIELDTRALISTAMVPVAAPDHPLAMADNLLPGAARDHIQLVLTDRSPLTEGRDFSVISSRTWRLADLGAKHALLRAGIGWGNMPLQMIEPDLAAGTLKRLIMPDHPGQMYPFFGIWRHDSPPGPAASWLLDQFGQCREGRKDAGQAAAVGL